MHIGKFVSTCLARAVGLGPPELLPIGPLLGLDHSSSGPAFGVSGYGRAPAGVNAYRAFTQCLRGVGGVRHFLEAVRAAHLKNMFSLSSLLDFVDHAPFVRVVRFCASYQWPVRDEIHHNFV